MRETKICQNCREEFTIEPEDFEFYEKISPHTKDNFGVGQEVPAPTWCAACRTQRRFSWRNEKTLYRRRCDAPGHNERIQQRNPLKLWHRRCMCQGSYGGADIVGSGQTGANYKNTIEHFHGSQPCPNEFETTYSPERPEIVYCEKCYIAEVA